MNNKPDKRSTQEYSLNTDIGKKRQNNEDTAAAVTLPDDTGKIVGLYAVADGMGGHDAGEVASDLAVRSAIQQFMQEMTTSDDMPANYDTWLRGAAAMANRMVRNKMMEDAKQMGTTLVMAAVVGNDVHIVNVGDSRAYVITPTEIRRITKDHSFVEMLMDSGAITPEEAATHPHRNVLTKAIGSDDNLTVDVFSEQLEAGSYVLLCSDGLWNELTEQQIWEIVMQHETVEDACQALVDATNAAGGKDNIAIVLVRVKP